MFVQPWLSEDEVVFHRMEMFHRRRIEAIGSGQSLVGSRDDGILVVHLIPRSSVQGRSRFDGTRLKEHGSIVSALGDDGNYAVSRFNVDGLLRINSGKAVESYSQIFRDGSIESVMSRITFTYKANAYHIQPDQEPAHIPRYLKEAACERAVFNLVKEYLTFCAGIGLQAPITMFSALIGCKGVYFYSAPECGFLQDGIDRSPAVLPDMDIIASDAAPVKLLRPWCDTLAQACGLEKSLNFDEAGEWRERRL